MKYLKKENTLEKRIRLDQKIIHAIENIALKNGESFSLALNEILEEYIKEKELFYSFDKLYSEHPIPKIKNC